MTMRKRALCAIILAALVFSIAVGSAPLVASAAEQVADSTAPSIVTQASAADPSAAKSVTMQTTAAKESNEDGAYKLGDVDNDGGITSLDALLVLKYSVSMVSLDVKQLAAGDVDGNGVVTSVDALNILKYFLQLIPDFPIHLEINPLDEALQDYSGKEYYLEGLTTASKVYVLNGDAMSREERNLAMSLQGIVAQTKSQIFLYYSTATGRTWREGLTKYYGIELVDIPNVWDLVDKFKDHLTDYGYVSYRQVLLNDSGLQTEDEIRSVNIASTIAGQEKYLIVDHSLEAQAQALGLVKKDDATQYDFYDIFDIYFDTLCKEMVVSLAPEESNGRDLGIAKKAFFWRDKDIGDLSIFLEEMVAAGSKNGLIFGWHNNEGTGVYAGSQWSFATVASDHANNYSLYAGLPKQKFVQTPFDKQEVKDNKNIHYLTMIMSDGDNIMWLETSFAENQKYWASQNRGAIPYGWTIQPGALEISPLFLNTFYRTATVNDEFVAAFSGLGYMYPDIYGGGTGNQEAALMEYYKRSAEYMAGTGLSYVSILEWSGTNINNAMRSMLLSAYSKYDSIKGGFLYYNGGDSSHQYSKTNAAAGSVSWSNDKPFVNLRESLADFSEAPTAETKIRLMSQMAFRLNRYKKDCTVIEGYSAINVHPWSFSYDDCVKMTKLLGDDVVVVTPSEFMQLISKNVPKTNVLALSDVRSFDYKNMPQPEDTDMYDSDNVKLKLPTTRTSFDFSDSTQGWVPFACDAALDQAYFQRGEEGKNEIVMAGSKFGKADDLGPNAMIYNKLTLPSSARTLSITGQSHHCIVRVVAYNEEGTATQLSNWTSWPNETSKHDVSLTKVAGKTVTLYIQFRDGHLNGDTIMINGIDIV